MRHDTFRMLAVILAAALLALPGISVAAEVVLYSSNPSELIDLVSQGFEQKTGIKASVVRLGTGEAMKRIAAEKDKPLCDVFWSGDVSVLEREIEAPATAAGVWQLLAAEAPAVVPYAQSVSVAVNADFARMTTTLEAGDEVAFLPPVSGG